jgi:membrane protease YdiL (CAAX protease family)
MRRPIGDGFLWFALAFELGLAGVALLIGWPIGVDPWRDLNPTPRGLLVGVLATGPMVGLLLLCDRPSIRPMRRIREVLEELILPYLKGRTPVELAMIAGAAGLGEETLFRGLIQAGLADGIGPKAGLVLASIAFGLLHALTVGYAVIAGLIGLYLGAIYLGTGDLTVPVVAHALYDLIALIHFLRTTSSDRIELDDPLPEEMLP